VNITLPRLIGLFQSQFKVDRCITELELHGFTANELSVILFSADRSQQQGRGLLAWIANGGVFGDTMDQSDGVSVMDGMTVAAAVGALWGVVWGSRMAWGPINVGLLGILAGGLVGYIVDRLIPEKRRGAYQTSKLKGFIQIEVVTDNPERINLVQKIFTRNKPDQSACIQDG
jgi:hypothetical protein